MLHASTQPSQVCLKPLGSKICCFEWDSALACCSHECVLTFEIVGGESESREGYLKKHVVLVPFSKSTKKSAKSSIDCLTPTSHLGYLTVTLVVQAQSQTLRPWALDTVDVTPKYPYSHGCGRLGDSRVLSCQRWNSTDCAGSELPTLQVLQRATCFCCRPKSAFDATALSTLPVGSAMVFVYHSPC